MLKNRYISDLVYLRCERVSILYIVKDKFVKFVYVHLCGEKYRMNNVYRILKDLIKFSLRYIQKCTFKIMRINKEKYFIKTILYYKNLDTKSHIYCT